MAKVRTMSNLTLDKSNNNLVKNPFFVGLELGNILKLNPFDIYSNYDCVYVVYIGNDKISITDVMNIFMNNINKDSLKKICEKFNICKVNLDILKNYELKKRCNIVSSKMLEYLFGDKYDYDITNIVLPLFEFNRDNTLNLIKLNMKHDYIDELDNLLSLRTYHNYSNRNVIDLNIKQLINKLGNECFWLNKKNCNFNVSKEFSDRKIKYNDIFLEMVSMKKIKDANSMEELIEKIHNNESSYEMPTNNIDIIKDEDNKKCQYINYYDIMKENNCEYFNINTEVNEKTKNKILNILKKTNEKERFMIMNKLLVSDKYWIYILQKEILQECKSIFEDYPVLFSYTMSYAILNAYLLENRNSNLVFDIDSACNFPSYPFSLDNIKSSPYIPLLIDEEFLNTNNISKGLTPLMDYKKYYGLCTKKEGIKRLNIFCTKDSKINIFEGMNSNVLAVCGSAMTACLQKYNPLLENYWNIEDYERKWNTYFSDYYGSSDIDIMCQTKNNSEYIYHATEFIQNMCKNLKCERKDIYIEPIKNSCVVISSKYFENCMFDLNNNTCLDFTMDDIKNIINNPHNKKNKEMFEELKEYFYDEYKEIKEDHIKIWNKLQEKNNVILDTELVQCHNSITKEDNIKYKLTKYNITEDKYIKNDYEIPYFINDFKLKDEKVPKNQNYLVFKFCDSIKYKFTSDKLSRPIEFFKINKTAKNTVREFYFPCVRAFYKNDTFYTFPSFICSMMTMICIDYKYFAGSRNPYDIINKYTKRGFTIIKNKNQEKALYLYNNNYKEKYDEFYVENKKKFYEYKTLNNNLYNKYYDENSLLETELKYVNSYDDLKKYYSDVFAIDDLDMIINIFKLKAKKIDGSINPFNDWALEGYYNYLNTILL
jgi:hypothetical protein